jgi:quinol monooxygenase YgiN
MPILMLIEVPNTSAADYERVNELANVNVHVPEGLISHTAALDGDTLLVADVWESQQALDTFLRERLGAAIAQVGMEGAPRFFPVHNHIAQGAGSEANVLLVWEADGFTPDAYDEITSRMPAHAGDGSSHPGVSHTAATTESGMVFADVWESEEAIHRFMAEQIQPAAGGAIPPGEPRFARVHNTIAGVRQPA